MIRRLCLFVAAVLAAIPVQAALAKGSDPVLVPEVSQHRVLVRQGFTGADLLLYGAILDTGGEKARAGYDIVVILRGPTQPIRVREKKNIAGIWINADSSDFRSVPSFYAIASSRPIKDIVDDRTAAIYEFGLDFLQLSPTGAIDPASYHTFVKGLVDLRERSGLYQQLDHGVRISEGVLYQARIHLPSNVQTGKYVAETFAVRDGQVIASATTPIEVIKQGFDKVVTEKSRNDSFAYGLAAVLLALSMGWAAGRIATFV